MLPSRMIELALADGKYLVSTMFMSLAICHVSKDRRRILRTRRVIYEAIAPHETLTGHLRAKLGEYPTVSQRRRFWKDLVKTLKEQNL